MNQNSVLRSSLLLSALISSLVISGCTKRADLTVDPDSKFDNKPKGARVDDAPKTDDQLRAKVLPNGEIENWFIKSPELEKVEGANSDRAISELKLPAGQTVIVAVVDSGVDIEHEDLKGKIWTNPGEIPGNGIDDDKNGYIDDVHGWNFIGGIDKDGKPVHIDSEQLEMTREVVRLKAKKAAQGGTLSPEDQAAFDKADKAVNEEREQAKATIARGNALLTEFKAQFAVIEAVIGKKFEELTLASVETLKSADQKINDAREKLVALFKDNNLTDVARIITRIENAQNSLDKYLNEDFQPRKAIVGDDPENYADRNYGNNDVRGPDASHGTHVSGIIAATRGNNVGIDGVAVNAIIMPVRVVPDGDERDKDIANGIRYAVDNGAKVINMSFGKKFSPGKAAVDEAFLYAESKSVLVIHSAGNDNTDTDGADNFPNRFVAKLGNRPIRTWLEIGASSSARGELLPAVFSNYGQHGVDFFSPGVRLMSTVPDNKYAAFSGTSMASPVVSGVAALILGQKPDLGAETLRLKLRQNVRKYDGLVVRLPGSDPIQSVLFSRLSSTGGIVDAFLTLKSILMPAAPMKLAAQPK